MKNLIFPLNLSPMKFPALFPDAPRLREATQLFVFGGLGLTLFFGVFGGINSLQSFWQNLLLNGIAFLIFGSGNGVLSDVLNKYISWTENPGKRFVVSMIATIVYTSIAWVFVVYLYIIPEDGFVSVSIWLSAVSKSTSSLRFTLVITFMVSAFIHGSSFLKEWRKALLEAEQLKQAQLSAQYETLKTQVNPHFLFNSLNVLSNLVHKDADLSEKFIQQLSKVYRYILESRDRDTVPLAEEVRNLESYVFLMKIRFGESLKFENTLLNIEGGNLVSSSDSQVSSLGAADNSSANLKPKTKNLKQSEVAPLTLQMLVENALKHNIVSKSTPLSIWVYAEDDFYVVKNSLQRKTSTLESTGIGLDNIKARYRILAGKEIQVEEDSGFFIVKVPKIG
jgi:sensor histidine kinase YesM